jgi:PEP-CTERM motif
VFSLSGGGLSINLNGASLFAKPTLNGATGTNGLNGTPFWNNDSGDGANDNVGFCIYGGGACNGGVGLDPTADYIAASSTTTGSANNITFSDSGGVNTNVTLSITADTDALGWYSTASPGTIHLLGGVGTYTFNPGGNFGLVGQVNGTTDFYSNTAVPGNTADTVSHFAFFTNATPEPSTFLLFGAGFLTLGSLRRRPAFLNKFGRSQK